MMPGRRSEVSNPALRVLRFDSMSAQDVEVATRFLSAAGVAVKSGDRDPLYALLTQDVEWVVPERTLHGIDDLREHLIWGFPPEHLDVEVEVGEIVDLGEGHVRSEIRQVYLWKETGEFAHERRRRIDLTIRDDKISRYEMRIVG
jgi:ketosteroid isomerase-like protein